MSSLVCSINEPRICILFALQSLLSGDILSPEIPARQSIQRTLLPTPHLPPMQLQNSTPPFLATPQSNNVSTTSQHPGRPLNPHSHSGQTVKILCLSRPRTQHQTLSGGNDGCCMYVSAFEETETCTIPPQGDHFHFKMHFSCCYSVPSPRAQVSSLLWRRVPPSPPWVGVGPGMWGSR